MKNESISESLTYLQDEPDIQTLRYAYDQTVTEAGGRTLIYADHLMMIGRNYWPGKSRDHRKHGADAFPWEGCFRH